MKIAIQRQIQTPSELNDADDGRMLTVRQDEFETIGQARSFLFNAQQKYGVIKYQEYFAPEQGSGSYYTEAIQDNDKFVTYHYYFDGFEGDLFNMLKDSVKQAKRMSIRDIKASIDYVKIADRDALIIEALAKKLHDYIVSGHQEHNVLNNLRDQILDLANDLNDVISNISNKDLIPEGAAKGLGLNKSAGALKRAIEDVQEEMSSVTGKEVSFEEAEAELNNRIDKANKRDRGHPNSTED
jgi:hypothetical protein